MIPDEREYSANDVFLQHQTEEPTEVLVQDITPIPVVVTDAVTVNDTYPQNLTAYTLVLDATARIQTLCPQDALRTTLTLVSLDEDVVMCHSLQQAQDPANADTTLARPNGFVISSGGGIIPPNGPFRTTQELWIVGNTFPARVSVAVERRSA